MKISSHIELRTILQGQLAKTLVRIFLEMRLNFQGYWCTWVERVLSLAVPVAVLSPLPVLVVVLSCISYSYMNISQNN